MELHPSNVTHQESGTAQKVGAKEKVTKQTRRGWNAIAETT